jgi:tetratricopeptide (TPR) repeat protein
MPHRRWKIIACLFLVVATLAVYAEVKNHQFVNYDDGLFVTDNPTVQGGLTRYGLIGAFTSTCAGLWHPLTMLSHMLDCQLFGLHPGGHHLTSLLFHIANTLLLFLWLQRTTGALGPSFLVAALFALHPLHVESVAWVAERKDVLSTFFWLLTMWAYVWYVEVPGLGRYLLTLVCFILGLMAKPMLVTLPFVLLLLDYWPLHRWRLNRSAAVSPSKGPPRVSPDSKTHRGVSSKRLAWEKAPLFALAALFSIVTFFAEKEVGAVTSLQDLAFTSRLANAMVAYVGYLGQMFWPAHLGVLYPLPGHNLPIWQALAAGLALAVLTLLALQQARRHPYLLVGWLWYLGTLLPVIGLVQVGKQAMADRYTYVPFIGLFIVVVWGMADLGARWRVPRFLLPVGAGVVLSALMICTWVQVSYWRDSISLFEHTLKVTGSNPLSQSNLGFALAAQGKMDQAIAHYAEALRLNPDLAKTHNILGAALAAQGKMDQAMAQYAEALRLQPDLAEAHNNLGLALAAQGKMDQAMAQYAEALRLKPDLAKAHNNLGLALAAQGKMDQAVAQYAEALRLKPDYAEAHNSLGLALAAQGKMDEAVAQYAEALRLKPDYAEVHNNLGLALAAQGEMDEAVAQYAEALRLNPDLAETQNNLGVALAKQGKIDEAIARFQKAIQINPDFPGAYSNLALALAIQGNIDKAIIIYQNDLKINPNNTIAQKMLSILKAQRPHN